MDDRMIDELYSLPLDGFTAARDELSRMLKARGETSAAAEVGKLKKPTVAAWAVNQVAREHPDDVRELVTLTDRLTSTDAAELRSAARLRSELIRRLTDSAREALERAGHSAGAATLDSVHNTFLAGTGEDHSGELVRGRLTKELSPTGLEAFSGFAASMTGDVADEPVVDQKAVRRAQDLAERAGVAEREAARLTREAEQAEVAATDAAAGAKRLRERALRAQDKAEEARRKADEALG